MSTPVPKNVVPLPRTPERATEDRLVATWLPVVLAWCARLGGPRVDPEDAAHDVMITLLGRADTLRDPAAMRAFAFGITRRTLAAHRRRAWLRRWVGPFDREPAGTELGPEGTLEARQLSAAVQTALEAISADHRELIVLVEIEGRSLAEAAELLSVPVGTVKSRLSRARDAFRVAARRAGIPTPEEAGWTS